MRKSFTRLLSLVMLFGFLALNSSFAVGGIGQTKVWPVDGTTPAYYKTTDKLMIIYPEAVIASTGSVRLSNVSGLVRVIPATDSRISYAKGDTIEIDFSGDLKELVAYSVTVDANAFKTADDGEASNAIISWAFTTGDYTAPTLKSVIPVKGAVVDNQTAYTLVMTFEDNAAAAVLKGAGNVALYNADGNVWDLIDVASQGVIAGAGPYTLTFSGLRPLEDNTNYYVTIAAGAVTDNGLRADNMKNAYAGSMDVTAWTFSTKDFSIPNFTSGYPKIANIGNTSADVLIKTDEVGKAYAVVVANNVANPGAAAIKAGVVGGAILAAGNVTVAAVNTEYSISLTGLGSAALSEEFDAWIIVENADVAAVDAQAVKRDIKTSENTAPKLFVGIAVSYNKGTALKTTGVADALNVITTAAVVAQDIDNIVLKFDEKVKVGAGAVTIRKALDNSIFATINATSLSVSGDVNVKIPVSGLMNDTKYYVQMPNTLVLDVYNNVYSGMSATNAWAFTTNDVIAPTFTIVPADGASGVKKDANVVVTFNEIVIDAPGAFEILEDGVSVPFVLTESTNDGKFTSYTLNPVADLESQAVVVVKINNNTLADGGGNFVAVQGQGTVFVVEDYVGPVLTWNKIPAKPADAAIIKFDEPVYLLGGGEITDANLFAALVVKETGPSGANVANTATISADKKTITIIPTSPWVSEKTYYIAITSDIQDAAGNKYDDITDPTLRTRTFMIDDVTPATVDLSSVDGKNISTTAPVTLIFKEGSNVEARTSLYFGGVWNAYALADMDEVIILKEGSAAGPDVPFTVTNAAADAATFGIIAALAGNKTYYVGVGASTKGADGNVNVLKFVSFTTKEEGVPTVVSLSPPDNSTEVLKNSNFVITYNTDVEKVTPFVLGSIYLTDGTTTTNVADGEVTISGKVVTINPASDLAENKTYDLVVAAGVFKNKNSVAVNTAIALDAWDFATKDTKLDIVSITPDEVINVAIDAKLAITFDEKVSIGTGNVDIKNSLTDALVERINISSSQVVRSNGDKTVTITPSNQFGYNVSYYVEVNEGALVDWVGNKSKAIFGKGATGLTDWTFTTADPAITVVKVTPKDGADKVINNATIVVEFNREVVAGAGSVGYIEVGTPDQLQAYPIGSTNVTVSGKTITITHSDKVFPADTEIYIYLEAGAVKAKTNPLILSPLVDKVNGAYSFHTGDVNAPVATVTPKAYSVTKIYEPVETNIVIEFDEPVYNYTDGTVLTNADVTSGGIFTVNDGTGNVNFIGTIVGQVVTLDPTSNLAENALVTVTVVANKVKDIKNVASGTQTFTFNTVDKTLPVVSAVSVTSGNKQLDFAATVADANNKEIYLLIKPKSDGANPTAAEVKAGVKKGSLASPSANVTHSFTGLMAATAYEIFYVAVDARGNETAVAKVEGSTFDTVAPLLVSTNPATGAVDVNVTTGGAVEVKLTFNEDVQAGAGLITIRDYATQAQIMVINQTALSTVAGDTKSLMLTIPGFASITTDVLKFYIEIASGTITDKSITGVNSYAGLFGMDALVLTSEDNMAPTVTGGTSGSPKLDADLTVEFSENVVGGSGTMILYKDAVAPANAVQVFYASDAVFSGKKATVNPTANLVNGQAYILAVGAGFAKDVSSNANLSVAGTRTFTGTTNPPPSINYFSPAGGTTPVAISSLTSICVDFSENIYLTVAGNLKPLTLLTQAEILANINFVDGNGVAVPIVNVIKFGGSHFDIYVNITSLKHESTYALTISGFQDVDGQVMTSETANYITSDGLPPSIVFNPALKATNVPVSTVMTLTFSENIFADVISANDSVWADVNNSNVETFVFLRTGAGMYAGTDVPFTATISGKVITITPKVALTSATRYYYGLKKTVEDINGQSITLGVEGTSQVYYDIKDIVSPELLPVTIGNFAPLGANTAPIAPMWVIFNEDVLVSTGSVVIRREDGTIFQTVSGSGLSIDGTNKKMLKIAHNPFEDVMNYFVELSASVVVDKSGNPNAAWVDPVGGWLFSTKETRDLQIVSLMPMGDNTARSAELKINFDKAPVAGVGKYVAVYKENGTAVHQILSSSFSVSGKTASFANVALDIDQAYYARIEPMAFTDAYGNNFDGIMDNSWVFSTVNNIAPEVAVLSPADNSKDVDPVTNYVMTFKNDILVGAGKIAVRKGSDGTLVEEVDVTKAMIEGKTLTFQLTTLLADNTDYYVIVPAGAVVNTEVTADPFAGILNTYTWNFTTGVYTCYPIKVTATVFEQLECSAVVEVVVETAGDYVLTMNGDTITAGKMTLAPGMYNFAAITGYICEATASLEVINVPVVRDTTVMTYIGEEVQFVDVEAGVDTMLVAGEYVFVYDYMGCERTLNVTVVEACNPIKVMVTLVKQMECSAMVNVTVQTVITDYVLTMNGDTIAAGEMTLEPGNYVFVASYLEGVCKDTKTLTVVSVPVVKNETVETYNGEAVNYMNEEAGVDTMLMAGVHTFTYDYEGCTRTLNVTVVAVMRTPTIADIQGEMDDSPLAGKTVKVVGTVTGVAPGEGFFIQDANAAWSGIWVEYSGATFQGIQIGNGVSVIGEVAEVANVTSIINITVTFVPPMVEITPIMLAPSDLKAEKYESVLVKVEGARATAQDAGNGEWTIYYQQTDNTVVNDWLYNKAVVVAGNYYDVTGVVNARLDNFKLEPRIESDVKDITITGVPELENTFKVYPNPFNDRILIDNNEKLTRVVISNIAGQRVIDIEYPNREIRTANLVSGIYVISLYTENGIAKTERMIKR